MLIENTRCESHQLDASGKETERETETWDIIGLEGSTYREKLILRDDTSLFLPRNRNAKTSACAKSNTVLGRPWTRRLALPTARSSSRFCSLGGRGFSSLGVAAPGRWNPPGQ